MIDSKSTMCRCMCGLMLKTEFLMTMLQIQVDYGKPITVVSGARCADHNKKVGGALKSAHVEGRAVDVKRSPALLKFLLDNAEKYNIFLEDPKYTPTWLHVTNRPYPTWKPGMPRTFKP